MENEETTTEQLSQDGSVEVDGIWLSLGLVVQCLRCVSQGRDGADTLVIADLTNPNPADRDEMPDYVAVCPRCTKELGVRAEIPIALVTGQDVEDTFGEDEPGEGEGAAATPAAPTA